MSVQLSTRIVTLLCICIFAFYGDARSADGDDWEHTFPCDDKCIARCTYAEPDATCDNSKCLTYCPAASGKKYTPKHLVQRLTDYSKSFELRNDDFSPLPKWKAAFPDTLFFLREVFAQQRDMNFVADHRVRLAFDPSEPSFSRHHSGLIIDGNDTVMPDFRMWNVILTISDEEARRIVELTDEEIYNEVSAAVAAEKNGVAITP